jgi:hypothetical protein
MPGEKHDNSEKQRDNSGNNSERQRHCGAKIRGFLRKKRSGSLIISRKKQQKQPARPIRQDRHRELVHCGKPSALRRAGAR